jgi:Fe-S cluster biogenesis protein NfuA/rhodanese-related sulfurtransferase
MGELLGRWPSAALTLFARFGVGGRDKLGFRPQQTLRQVLARHLLFDVERVLARLEEAERAQRAYRVSPLEFAAALGSACLIDCRSAPEFGLGSLPGARLLDAALAAEVKGQAVLLFDQQGPMAGAAAVHLAQLGCSPRVLDGGLLAWAEQVDPTFPCWGGSGPSRILPDWRQARFACAPVERAQEGQPNLVPFECLRLWRSRNYVAVLRAEEGDWPTLSRQIHEWLPRLEDHPWREQPREDWSGRLERVLVQEVQPDLVSHKGQVQLVGVQEGVARVSLGGGCQGCSSAAITVGQDIAAALYRAVPELEGVVDASDHDAPEAQPHH